MDVLSVGTACDFVRSSGDTSTSSCACGDAEIRTQVREVTACGPTLPSKPIHIPQQTGHVLGNPIRRYCTSQETCSSLALPIKDSNLNCLVQSQVSYR